MPRSKDLAPSPAIGTCSLGLLAPNFVQPVALDAAGGLQIDLDVPAVPQLQGAAARLQFAFAEGGGLLLGVFTTARAIEALLGN